jgi:hypothetical protein
MASGGYEERCLRRSGLSFGRGRLRWKGIYRVFSLSVRRERRCMALCLSSAPFQRLADTAGTLASWYKSFRLDPPFRTFPLLMTAAQQPLHPSLDPNDIHLPLLTNELSDRHRPRFFEPLEKRLARVCRARGGDLDGVDRFTQRRREGGFGGDVYVGGLDLCVSRHTWRVSKWMRAEEEGEGGMEEVKEGVRTRPSWENDFFLPM